VAVFSVSVSAQTKTIVVGESVRGAMYLPAYIAEEKGFFRKRGLDTTFSQSKDINALVSGGYPVRSHGAGEGPSQPRW
jgi:ABC-type nitrate/sulfonate/bicarbonate transport system substrate-binding protein